METTVYSYHLRTITLEIRKINILITLTVHECAHSSALVSS